ncbi:MAG: suppressor of fused domain protein [Clostridiales Family XIII bacterium]|jgi:hypothetical protein|nr:suppressor of fused domain protein [Clostridiales Family XIII bacterium]
MGFFKELRDAWKEGVEEAKAEAAEERAAEAAETAAAPQREAAERRAFLDAIPYEEKFGLALAAPFRTTIFMDWFSVFKDNDTDEEFPKHLYTVGEAGAVKKADLKNLKTAIARDFEITGEQSALLAIGQIFAGGAIPSETEFPGYDTKAKRLAYCADVISTLNLLDGEQKKDALTFIVNMAAHATAASANAGFLTAETAGSLFRDLGIFIKSLYADSVDGGSWEEYGARFLAANDIFEMNKEKGMKALRKAVDDLGKKPGSPWVNVPFRKEGEEAVTFDELAGPPLNIELYEENEIGLLEAHIETCFGHFDKVLHEFASPDIHLDVAIVDPTAERNRRVLVTMGAGTHIMDVPEELDENDLYRMELLLVLPADWSLDLGNEKDCWPVQSLKRMGRYALENETWLGWGHTVQFSEEPGESIEGTGFVGFVLVQPMGFNADGNACKLPNGSDVNFYQILALYENEMAYKVENGTDALLERFFERFGAGYDGVIEVGRPSAVL